MNNERGLVPALLFAIFVINLASVVSLNGKFNEIRDQMIFNVDQVRKDYKSNLNMIYMRGCMKGIDEMEENYQGSSMQWCSDHRMDIDLDEYIQGQVENVGRLRECH